jgi:hypothetical protein
MMQNFIIKVFLFSIILIAAAEFILRWTILSDDERNTLYRYDQELGWFPKEGLKSVYGKDPCFHVSQNSLGFRDREFSDKTLTRVAFVGDSVGWGYDSEVDNRFDRFLTNQMSHYEFINLCISGYGTDQEILLLHRFLSILQPDIVYLLFHPNDRYENMRNRVYNGYYKPYYKIGDNGGLILHGTPVPMALHYMKHKHPLIFQSNVVKYISSRMLHLYSPEKINPDITEELLLELRHVLESQNVELKIGIVGSYSENYMKDILHRNHFDYVVIDNTGRDVSPHLFTQTGHWTIKGNMRAAQVIQRHLENPVLPPNP